SIFERMQIARAEKEANIVRQKLINIVDNKIVEEAPTPKNELENWLQDQFRDLLEIFENEVKGLPLDKIRELKENLENFKQREWKKLNKKNKEKVSEQFKEAEDFLRKAIRELETRLPMKEHVLQCEIDDISEKIKVIYRLHTIDDLPNAELLTKLTQNNRK